MGVVLSLLDGFEANLTDLIIGAIARPLLGVGIGFALRYLLAGLSYGPRATRRADRMLLDDSEASAPSEAAPAGVDLSLVSVDVGRHGYSESEDMLSCVTKLLYGGSLVCEWSGLCEARSDGALQSGICSGRLSRDNATLTLQCVDGLLKIDVLEVVEGWLLGVGCPEPQGAGGRRRLRKQEGSKGAAEVLKEIMTQQHENIAEVPAVEAAFAEEPSAELNKTASPQHAKGDPSHEAEVLRAASPSRARARAPKMETVSPGGSPKRPRPVL